MVRSQHSNGGQHRIPVDSNDAQYRIPVDQDALQMPDATMHDISGIPEGWECPRSQGGWPS